MDSGLFYISYLLTAAASITHRRKSNSRNKQL